jgi:hypothetical protein
LQESHENRLILEDNRGPYRSGKLHIEPNEITGRVIVPTYTTAQNPNQIPIIVQIDSYQHPRFSSYNMQRFPQGCLENHILRGGYSSSTGAHIYTTDGLGGMWSFHCANIFRDYSTERKQTPKRRKSSNEVIPTAK